MSKKDGKKWFYVDITTTSNMRIAVRAKDAEAAKDAATLAVDTGVLNPTDTAKYRYGSSTDSYWCTEGDGPKRPPKSMHRLDGSRRTT